MRKIVFTRVVTERIVVYADNLVEGRREAAEANPRVWRTRVTSIPPRLQYTVVSNDPAPNR